VGIVTPPPNPTGRILELDPLGAKVVANLVRLLESPLLSQLLSAVHLLAHVCFQIGPCQVHEVKETVELP
jgi:hypothetical protein